MPTRPYRCYGAGYLHFITMSCYQRWPLLGSAEKRDLFLEVLEQTRCRHRFVVVGYVVMPEHVHLLVSEPRRCNISTIIQAIKQSFVRKLLRHLRAALDPRQSSMWNTAVERSHIWQRRFYDFVVFTHRKRIEKLRYMHRNPVKRGLVLQPGEWRWRSYRSYAYDESGPVLVNEQQKAEMVVREVK